MPPSIFRLLCLLPCVLALMSCAGQLVSDFPSNPDINGVSANSVNGVYTGSNLYFYGRFCGPDWPKIQEPDPQKALQILVSIQAVDQLDQICKHHDICYATHSYFYQDCDNVFFRSVDSARFSKTCKNYAILLEKSLDAKFSYKPIPASPDQITLFGFKELQMHGSPWGSVVSFPYNTFDFTILNGLTKPQPGEC